MPEQKKRGRPRKDGPRTPSGQLSRATGADRHSFPLRAEEPATEVWAVRLTEGEARAARAAMEASGLSRADWMRSRLACPPAPDGL